MTWFAIGVHLQKARFWRKTCLKIRIVEFTCHIRSKNFTQRVRLLVNKINMSDSEIKILGVTLWIKNFTTCHILYKKTYKSDVEFKSLRVRFWIKIFTTCQILNWKFHYLSDRKEKFYNASDSEGSFLPRVRFWN